MSVLTISLVRKTPEGKLAPVTVNLSILDCHKHSRAACTFVARHTMCLPRSRLLRIARKGRAPRWHSLAFLAGTRAWPRTSGRLLLRPPPSPSLSLSLSLLSRWKKVPPCRPASLIATKRKLAANAGKIADKLRKTCCCPKTMQLCLRFREERFNKSERRRFFAAWRVNFNPLRSSNPRG